jgi:hypothetical protein
MATTTIVTRNTPGARLRRSVPARRAPVVRALFLDNPLRAKDPELAGAAERAVAAALKECGDERLGAVRVRFSVVDDGEALRFVCKVESAGVDGASAWRWWSAIVDAPDVLQEDLASSLERRRQRLH